jgi:hypothetical protein
VDHHCLAIHYGAWTRRPTSRPLVTEGNILGFLGELEFQLSPWLGRDGLRSLMVDIAIYPLYHNQIQFASSGNSLHLPYK